MSDPARISRPDIRTETLLQFFTELEGEPGRKRDRLYKAVLRMIERGFWNPGDRLPTDAEFSQLLPLSVATVQAALKMLADQRIVVRKQKQGSFIASVENLSRDHVFFRFRRTGDRHEAEVTVSRFAVDETEEPGPGRDFFDAGRPILRITRDCDVAGAFRVVSELYLADPRLRILLDLDPATLKDLAIRTLLQTRFGLPSVRFEWRLRMERFAPDLCARLGLPEGSAGQVADTEVYTVNDEKLMLQRMWIPQSDWALLVRA